MEYLKINGADFSHIVKALKVSNTANYNSQTNAAGNMIVDFINKKRVVEVGFIPLTDETMKQLLAAIEPFNITLSFRNPLSGELEEINCIIPSNDVDYYTIQIDKVMYNSIDLKFVEL